MDIIEYDAGYKEAFIRFNTDWITDNFGFLEKEDFETFENIENELAGGATIFFVVPVALKYMAHILLIMPPFNVRIKNLWILDIFFFCLSIQYDIIIKQI